MAERRTGFRTAFIVGAFLVLAALALGVLPPGPFVPMVEEKLSHVLDAKVRIGGMERRSLFSFHPTIEMKDVRVAQPRGFGDGEMLHLRRARFRIPIWPLLFGRVHADAVLLDRLTLDLRRTKAGEWNLTGEGGSGGGAPRISDISISSGRLHLNDAKRELVLRGTLVMNRRQGLYIKARGQFSRQPARLTLRANRLAPATGDKPYSYRLFLSSPILAFAARGTMEQPFALNMLKAHIEAQGSDLHYLDKLIEAGLFHSQPFRLSADVAHQDEDWNVTHLAGHLGRSMIDGSVSVRHQKERNKISGNLHSTGFDFTDLSSDAQQRHAAARTARIGERVLPTTRIDLSHIGPTDGTIDFALDRLLVKGGSVFKSLSGRLILDHRVLTADNLRARLTSGVATGTAKVEHQSGAPKFSLDIRLKGGQLAMLFGNKGQAAAEGDLAGHFVLSGSGTTIAEALGRSSGKVGLASRSGDVPAGLAAVLGQDIGKTIGAALSGKKETTRLRCIVANFTARNGVLTPAPLILDTSSARADGQGRVNLSDETIALLLHGAPKQDVALRSDQAIAVEGTLSDPMVRLAGKNGKKEGPISAVLSAIGNVFDSNQAPRAQDADCTRLVAKALS